MKVRIDNQEVEIKELDWHMGVGIQANALMRLSLARPDLEFRVWNGRLEATYRADQTFTSSCEVVLGCAMVEATIDDWAYLVAMGAALPRQEVPV